MLASLLCCNGRDYSDYDISDEKKDSPNENTAFNKKGNLGGLEERASGHGNTNPLHHHQQRQQQHHQQQQQQRTRQTGPGQYAAQDADRKGPAGLSTLFDSIRSGLGGGADGDAADSFAGGAVGGGVGSPGCGVVVQHVSCRRRKDSGSSSDSESDRSRRSPAKAGSSSATKGRQVPASGDGARKVRSAETNGLASRPLSGDRRHKERSEGESRGIPMYARGGHDSEEDSLRVSSLSHSLSSDASVNTVKEKRGGGGGKEEASRLPVAKQKATNQQTKKSEIPQPVNRSSGSGGDGRQKRGSGGPALRQQISNTPSDAERPASGCSFTSSEWGEVTPTESLHSLHTQPSADKRDDTGSALGHSSGYASASRRSVAEIGGDSVLNNSTNQQQNGSNLVHRSEDSSPSPAAAKSKTSPSKLPVRKSSWQNSSKESSDPEPAFASSATIQPESHSHQHILQHQAQSNTPPSQQTPQHQIRSAGDHLNESAGLSAAQTHIRRQSSGRSETWSIATSKTASPTTKMRLLDLASNRALERDGSDSVQSWSGGSEDTMSLGMSCSGVATSADAPVFQKVQYNKHRKGSHEAEVQYVPNINQSLHLDGDGNQSDGDIVSPGLRPNSATPKRGSPHRLSTPSMVTSHASSQDEKKSGEGTDDENIDELFAQHRKGSKLGVSRSSIGSSRESLASVYSDAGEINYGRIPVSGDITFALEYDHKNTTLKILLRGCRDLAPVDVKHNRSDPYVKVYLLPDKTRSGKRKSKIKKHTLNPVYDEILTYNILQGELENRVLWVTVWHSDRFGRNDFLGEVTIPMDMHRFGDSEFNTYTLESRVPDTMNEEFMQYKGDLVISIMYITPDNVTEGKKSKSKSKSKKSKGATEPQGEVHVLIKEAKNLTAVRSNGTSDPFVKGYLLPDRGRNAKQKTSVMKNSVNPAWNHTLVFDNVDAMELADRSLELTVWDHEKLGTNEFLGGARLNLGMGVVKGGHQVDWMDARGEESITWQNMMERPNTWIDAKLPLRASMGKSSKK